MELYTKDKLSDITYVSEFTPPSKRSETGGRIITTKFFLSVLGYQSKSIEAGVISHKEVFKEGILTYVFRRGVGVHKSSAQ